MRKARFWAACGAMAVVALVGNAGLRASSTTPQEALTRLKDGNARFVNDALKGVPLNRARRQVLASGQEPYAIVLSCADSRVPPEHIFNAGLGELFVVRTAGEVADHAVLASVEYAAEHLHSPLLVVMGHESCGAVKAATDSADGHELGAHLEYLVKHIKPAVNRAHDQPEAERLHAAILANVEEVINEVVHDSPIVSHLLDAGEMQVVGGYYELASGRVLFTKPIDRAPMPTLTSLAPRGDPTAAAHPTPVATHGR